MPMSGIGNVPDFGTPAMAGAGSDSPMMIEVVNVMDGQVLGRKLVPVLEKFSKSGKLRTHTQAVKKY